MASRKPLISIAQSAPSAVGVYWWRGLLSQKWRVINVAVIHGVLSLKDDVDGSWMPVEYVASRFLHVQFSTRIPEPEE